MPPKSYSLTRTFKTACEITPEVVSIAQMFGIGCDEAHVIELYRDLNVLLGPGRVIFITGDSGGGKSSLIRDLRAKAAADDWSIIEPPQPEDRPLVNLFGDLKEAVEILTYAGLSEAFVMLRKPKELSDGQRYRLMFALAMKAAAGVKSPVLFMDEFLANLDRETARGVAYQVRKVATKTGLCFVLATTHLDILEDLNPNQVVTLRLGLPAESDRRLVA